MCLLIQTVGISHKNEMTEKEAEPASKFSHVLPGEHVYEGILFFGYSPPDILDAVKDFEVRDDDVFLATYPKAGKFKVLKVVCSLRLVWRDIQGTCT